MENHYHSIQLVEGTYSFVDSADVLLTLIADKIKFHNLQMLTGRKKTRMELDHSEKRIAELKESRKMVTQLILEARNSGYDLKIDGEIRIEMIKQNDLGH